tara:strand:+ start:4560 stop:4832 length:273 start_codon:yes stop_codon:yes gene_type:complete
MLVQVALCASSTGLHIIGLPTSPVATNPVKVALAFAKTVTDIVPKTAVADTPVKVTVSLGMITVPKTPVADAPVTDTTASGDGGTSEYVT